MSAMASDIHVSFRGKGLSKGGERGRTPYPPKYTILLKIDFLVSRSSIVVGAIKETGVRNRDIIVNHFRVVVELSFTVY